MTLMSDWGCQVLNSPLRLYLIFRRRGSLQAKATSYILRPVYSDATQLNSMSSWVELCRFICSYVLSYDVMNKWMNNNNNNNNNNKRAFSCRSVFCLFFWSDCSATAGRIFTKSSPKDVSAFCQQWYPMKIGPQKFSRSKRPFLERKFRRLRTAAARKRGGILGKLKTLL